MRDLRAKGKNRLTLLARQISVYDYSVEWFAKPKPD